MKRFITMVAVSVLVGVCTARAADEVKTAPDAAIPAQGVTAEKAPTATPTAEATHCLAIKDGVALCCACGGDCKCTLAADGKTCSCGKAVKECPLAGKSCCEKCLQVSDKAGMCPKCGMEMKAVPAKTADAPK